MRINVDNQYGDYLNLLREKFVNEEVLTRNGQIAARIYQVCDPKQTLITLEEFADKDLKREKMIKFDDYFDKVLRPQLKKDQQNTILHEFREFKTLVTNKLEEMDILFQRMSKGIVVQFLEDFGNGILNDQDVFTQRFEEIIARLASRKNSTSCESVSIQQIFEKKKIAIDKLFQGLQAEIIGSASYSGLSILPEDFHKIIPARVYTNSKNRVIFQPTDSPTSHKLIQSSSEFNNLVILCHECNHELKKSWYMCCTCVSYYLCSDCIKDERHDHDMIFCQDCNETFKRIKTQNKEKHLYNGMITGEFISFPDKPSPRDKLIFYKIVVQNDGVLPWDNNFLIGTTKNNCFSLPFLTTGQSAEVFFAVPNTNSQNHEVSINFYYNNENVGDFYKIKLSNYLNIDPFIENEAIQQSIIKNNFIRQPAKNRYMPGSPVKPQNNKDQCTPQGISSIKSVKSNDECMRNFKQFPSEIKPNKMENVNKSESLSLINSKNNEKFFSFIQPKRKDLTEVVDSIMQIFQTNEKKTTLYVEKNPRISQEDLIIEILSNEALLESLK